MGAVMAGAVVSGAVVIGLGTELALPEPVLPELALPELALSAARHLGLALLLGGAFARRWWSEGRPGAQRLWPLAVGAALLALGGTGSAAYTLALFGVLSPAELSAYLLTEPAGRALVLALIGALLLLAAEAGRWPWPLLLPGAGLLLGGLSAQGHAALHGWPTLLTGALHLGAMSVWLGGVAHLALGAAPAREAVDRMTSPALLCLLTLAWTGAFAALVGSGGGAALVASAYGRVLGGKLALVLAAVAAAGWLRWRLYRALPPRPALRLELALLLLVLLASAWLGNTPPGVHTS